MPLEGKAKKHFHQLQDKLELFADCLRFQNPQTPHLTLQFWKELMEIEYDQIIQQAGKIASAHSPFMISVIGADTFGSRGEDQVLYLTVAFSDELARIKKSCPWPSEQKFAPHITLARIRHPQKFAVHKKKIFKLLSDMSFDIPVDRLRLYAEVEGVKQTPLRDFELL